MEDVLPHRAGAPRDGAADDARFHQVAQREQLLGVAEHALTEEAHELALPPPRQVGLGWVWVWVWGWV